MDDVEEAVGFTRMDEGTYEDYQLLDRKYKTHVHALADSALDMLKRRRLHARSAAAGHRALGQVG